MRNQISPEQDGQKRAERLPQQTRGLLGHIAACLVLPLPGPHFSVGRAMLAPVHYDDQVPSPPSLLKVRRQSVRLSDQPALFWSDWGKSSAREIGRIFERLIFLRKRGLDSCFLVEVDGLSTALEALW